MTRKKRGTGKGGQRDREGQEGREKRGDRKRERRGEQEGGRKGKTGGVEENPNTPQQLRELFCFRFSRSRCPGCRYYGLEDLDVHLHNAHPDVIVNFYCKTCYQAFMSRTQRDAHIRDNHSNRKQCYLCHFSSNTMKSINRHVHAVHLREVKTCNWCNYSNVHMSSVSRHMRQVHGEYTHFNACTFCPKKFVHKRRLLLHLLTKHSIDSF